MTTSTKPATQAPASKPAPSITGNAAKEESYVKAAELLTDFIAYRREQLRQQVGPPGINRSASAAIVARDRENVLAEFSALADWLADGCRKASTVLSEPDRAFWLAAKERGIEVPPQIASQL